MSFSIDIILVDVPTDHKTAWQFIENLREEYYEDTSGAHEKFTHFHHILTETYPCLCRYEDDDLAIEDCPWADGPLIENFASKMGMVSIVWPRVQEVFPFVLDRALSLGMIVVDGQNEKIYRPKSAAGI